MTELSMTSDMVFQLVLFFIAIPVLILGTFALITRAVEGRDRETVAGLSWWYLTIVVPLAFVGLAALNTGNGYFITLTASLAQSVPMMIGTFKYYQLKTVIEKRRRDAEINDLCGRLEAVEGRMGIMLDYSPERVRKR